MKSSHQNRDTLENQIASLLQEGDEKAISLIYQNYANTLYGFIYKIIPNDSLAEEVLQDTFIKIWKNAAQYNRKKGRLFTWFINIARNTAIDRVRSAAFQRNRKTGSIENIVNKDELGTEEISIEDPELRKIINSLDKKHQILIDLVYFHGYSQREIEKELNIPLGTVKSRIRIAIKELRTKLGDDFAQKLLTILLAIVSLTDLLY